MSQRRAELVAAAVLTIALVATFFDVLFLGYGLVRGDLLHYHYPMKRIVRDAILSGEFPWWNRFYSGGQPMAANPAYEVFYPGQWLSLAGSFRFGFNLHIVFHVWLAAIGMLALLRGMRLSIPASLLGAFSFAFGGLFFSFLTTLPMGFVWSWTPLSLVALQRAVEQRRRAGLAFAALVLGMQALVGEPVSLALNWLLFAAATLFFVRRNREIVPGRAFRIAGVTLLFSVLVAAVQIIPAIDHLRDTARGAGLPYERVVRNSTVPDRALELFMPHWFGHHANSGSAYWGVGRMGTAPYIANIYLGLLIAVCAATALLRVPRAALAVFGFSALAYILATGGHTPLFRILYETGAARLIRYPEKFLPLALFPVILLAVWTFDRIREEPRTARIATMVAAGFTLIAAGIAAFAQRSSYVAAFQRAWRLTPAQAERLASIARHDAIIALASGAVLTLLLVLAVRRTGVLWHAAMALFVVADLRAVTRELTVRMPPSFFQTPGSVAAVPEAATVAGLFHLGEWRDIDPRYFQTGDQSYWLVRNSLAPPVCATWGVRTVLDHDYDVTYLEPTRSLLAAMEAARRTGAEGWWQPFAAVSNVRYVADYRAFDDVIRECRGNLALSRPVVLRSSRKPHPRYYLARHVVRADEPGHAAAIRAEGWREGFAVTNAPAVESAAGGVVAVSESGSRAIIDTESEGRSLLVMTVTRHRYWRATVDGTPTRLYPANLGYQALIVPPGRHRVEMRYRNPFVLAAGALSGTTLLALLFVLVRDRW